MAAIRPKFLRENPRSIKSRFSSSCRMFIGPLSCALGGRVAVSGGGVQKKLSMTEMERPSTGTVLRCAVMLTGHRPAWGFWLPAAAAGIYPDGLAYFNEAACLTTNPGAIGLDGGTRCGPLWLD